MRVRASEIIEAWRAVGSMWLPKYIDDAACECLAYDLAEYDVPDTFRDDVEKSRAEYEYRQRVYDEVSEHRLTGMQLEEVLDYAGAISEYAIAIILGEQCRYDVFTAYAYAYQRIFVCLRKAKDAEREITYLERYLQHTLSEAEVAKYSSRLERLRAKHNQA